METSNQPFLLTLAPSIINNVISHQGKDNNLIFAIKLLALQGHQAVPICFFLLLLCNSKSFTRILQAQNISILHILQYQAFGGMLIPNPETRSTLKPNCC